MQFLMKGKYSYHEQDNHYTGFLSVEEETIGGTMLDPEADCLSLLTEGKVTREGGCIILEITRKGAGKIPFSNSLSDPIDITVSKKDDGKLEGKYEGTYEFAEKCYNWGMGHDDAEEKAVMLIPETQTSAKIELTLEELV